LEAGVKIYETQNLVLHSKTAVIDGVWSVVGSSNFDRRSVLFNDEVDAVVLGAATAQELQAMFDNDTKGAKQIDLASWRRRSILQRVNELYSTIWQDWL
jgi:cardiolipin synthase